MFCVVSVLLCGFVWSCVVCCTDVLDRFSLLVLFEVVLCFVAWYRVCVMVWCDLCDMV